MSGKLRILAPTIEDAVNAEVDIFGRDGFAEGLINIFRRSDDPLVAVLDEPWGTGKTVFARRLKKQIDSISDIDAIYFDAFANDHEADPFIAVAAAIIANSGKPTPRNRLRKKARDVGKILARAGAKGAIRVASAGVIRASDLSEASQEVAAEIGDLFEAELDTLIDRRLMNFAKDQASFSAFRSALSNYSDNPTVFIIDELDRCKPDYSLKLLETVKHFFRSRNIHFLLIGNMESLESSVKHTYGLSSNSSLYLQKFIDIRLTFPYLSQQQMEKSARNFVGRAFSGLIRDQNNGELIDNLQDFLVEGMRKGSYSLRDVEKLASLIKMAVNFSRPNTLRLVPIIAILVDMKLLAPDLYRKAKACELSYAEVAERYSFPANPEDEHRSENWYAMWWKYCLENPTGDKWADFGRGLYRYSVGSNRRDIVAWTALLVVDALG